MSNEPTKEEIQEWRDRYFAAMRPASQEAMREKARGSAQASPESIARLAAGAAQSHDGRCYDAWQKGERQRKAEERQAELIRTGKGFIPAPKKELSRIQKMRRAAVSFLLGRKE